jgi:antitoxin component YwqK of YwqJK toxin-antitoxin module
MDDLIEREGLYYEKFKDVPFTGKVTGQKQGKISKGKREGEWIWYYENGQLSSKSNYKDGKEEGEGLFYDENGQLYD